MTKINENTELWMSFSISFKTLGKTYFPNNFGVIDEFYYPITHKEAENHLNNFIQRTNNKQQ